MFMFVLCIIYMRENFKEDHLSVTMSKTAPKVETEPGK